MPHSGPTATQTLRKTDLPAKVSFFYGIFSVDRKGNIFLGAKSGVVNTDVVIRLNANGSVDRSFASQGIWTPYKLKHADSCRGILPLNDGSTIVLMEGNDFNGTLVKLDPQGKLSSGFGVKGIKRFPSGYSTGYTHGMTVLQSGKILLNYQQNLHHQGCGRYCGGVFGVSELDASTGEFDPHFGKNGFVVNSNWPTEGSDGLHTFQQNSGNLIMFVLPYDPSDNLLGIERIYN